MTPLYGNLALLALVHDYGVDLLIDGVIELATARGALRSLNEHLVAYVKDCPLAPDEEEEMERRVQERLAELAEQAKDDETEPRDECKPYAVDLPHPDTTAPCCPRRSSPSPAPAKRSRKPLSPRALAALTEAADLNTPVTVSVDIAVELVTRDMAEIHTVPPDRTQRLITPRPDGRAYLKRQAKKEPPPVPLSVPFPAPALSPGAHLWLTRTVDAGGSGLANKRVATDLLSRGFVIDERPELAPTAPPATTFQLQPTQAARAFLASFSGRQQAG